MTFTPVFALRCQVQPYAWGKLGTDSSVARYAAQAHVVPVDAETPYAELWMGTHPNAPSLVHTPANAALDKRPLGQVIAEQPEHLLSAPLAARYGELPFLFKVLSVRKALSIQAHPDKQLATELFTRQPDRYRDPNHKPEMAIALTEFEAMCGFRPVEDIAQNIMAPELVRLLGESAIQRFITAANEDDDTVEEEEAKNGDTPCYGHGALVSTTSDSLKAALKELFSRLMRSDSAKVAAAVTSMCARFERLPSATVPGTIEELVIRLNQQFPGDIGCLCPLLLNVVTLQPGEALFLGANEPHAYISGDCIECMASSDNVVRAGLTPKFIDVDVLVEMLTYSTRPASQVLLTPQSISSATELYNPPIEEFSVLRTRLDSADAVAETLPARNGPSILIVVNGHAALTSDATDATLSEGDVYFIAPQTAVTLTATKGAFQCYTAYCEL